MTWLVIRDSWAEPVILREPAAAGDRRISRIDLKPKRFFVRHGRLRMTGDGEDR
jgi:hypothetical protein